MATPLLQVTNEVSPKFLIYPSCAGGRKTSSTGCEIFTHVRLGVEDCYRAAITDLNSRGYYVT
jgi:hypothetical protein